MKRIRLPRLNRLFYKILLCFLSLLIPVVVVGAFTYLHFLAKIKEDNTEKIAYNLQSSARTIDIYLRTVQGTSHSFYKDTVVGNLLKPYADYAAADKAELVNLLASISSTQSVISDLAENVIVYIDNEKVYSASGIDDFRLFFGKFNRYDAYPPELWEQFLHSGKLFEILPPTAVQTSLHEKSILPMVTRHLIKGHSAVLVANVSVDMLMRTVAGGALFDTTRYIVTGAGGELIFMTPFPGFNEHDFARMLTQQEASSAGGSLVINGTPYAVSLVESGLFGWNYYALTPVHEFYNQARGMLNLLIGVCSVLIVLGFLFSFLFTFNLYNPIRKIREILVSRDGEDQHDHSANRMNELVWIGNGIHRLIHNNRTFQSRLNTLSAELAEHFINGLFRGNGVADQEELNAVFSEVLGFDKCGYQCCAILFEFTPAFDRDLSEADRHLVLSKMRKLIGGLLQEFANGYVVNSRQDLYICVFNTDDDAAGRLAVKKSLESFMNTFRYDALYCRIAAGLGRLYTGSENIIESYREAMSALQGRDAAADFQIIEVEERQFAPGYFYSYADEHKIINAVKLGDYEVLKENIAVILRGNEQRSISLYSFHVLVSELYKTGLKMLQEFDLAPDCLLAAHEHARLNDTKELTVETKEKRELLLEYYRRLTQIAAERRKAMESAALVTAIINYIDEHFDHELYLEKISLHMKVSAKYISRVFKEKMGKNLMDYIHWKRIAKAKELLEKTTLPINVVAESVGIYSRSTFLRLFKNAEGISPNEYRKMRAVAGYKQASNK